MPPAITCPRCRSQLQLPPERSATGFTCPRCLASVPVPEAITTAASIQASPPTSGARRLCSACGKELEESWRCCPVCMARIDDPRAETINLMTLPADVDVSGDSQEVKIALILLAALCGLGAIFGALTRRITDGLPFVLLLGLAAFFVFLFLGLVARRAPGNVSGLAHGLQGCLTCLSVFGALVLAVVVFAFVACATGGIR